MVRLPDRPDMTIAVDWNIKQQINFSDLGLHCLPMSHEKDACVKVFRIIPEFRILRLTFPRKSASKC